MLPKQISDAEFEQEVLNSKGTVLVDFFADWCEPCKVVSRILDDIGRRANGSLKIVKMDVMKNQNTASTYMIMSLPTVMVFKDGIPTLQKTGLVDRNEYEKLIP